MYTDTIRSYEVRAMDDKHVLYVVELSVDGLSISVDLMSAGVAAGARDNEFIIFFLNH